MSLILFNHSLHTSGTGVAARENYLCGLILVIFCIGDYSISEEVVGFFTFLVFPSEMLCPLSLVIVMLCLLFSS